MNSRIDIEYALRPCIVTGKENAKNALFHRWVDVAEVIPPSPLRGGHGGGQLWAVYGLVEYEDGSVQKVFPERIRFIDRMHSEFVWEEEKHDG